MASWLEERQDVPVGTVMDQDSGPRTILRDWDTLIIGGLRLDRANCEALRKIIVGEALNLALVHDEIAEDEADAATAAGEEG